MVERILKWLNREWGSIHEAALLLALSSFAADVLGLVRDRLLAASFGAGRVLDIYYTAFRVPDLLYVTIASFVSVTVLIPFIIDRLSRGEVETTKRFLDNILTVFLLVMFVVLAVVWLLAPVLAPWLAPGFSLVERTQLVTLVRILLLSPLLLGLSNLFGAVTQSTQRFFVYALSPVLYNVGVIIGIIALYPLWGLPGLVVGVVLGAVFHLAIQFPGVWRSGLFPRLRWINGWREIGEVVAISLPRSLTLAASQLALTVLVSLASVLGIGAVAVFNFAMNLQSIPMSIIGVSYSVAAFPLLVKLYNGGEKKSFIDQLTSAMRHVLFWSLPSVVLFIVLRAQIVRVLLGAGKFSWQDTRLTAAALALFAVSVLGQNLVLLLVRAYYAAGRTTRPLVVNALSSLSIVITGWLLVRWPAAAETGKFFETMLRVSDLSGTRVLLLPLAFTVGTTLNAVLLWIFFQRDFGRFPKVVDRALGQSVVGSLVAGIVSYQALNWLAPLLNLNTFVGIFIQGLVAGLLGLAVLYLLLKYFNNKELAELEKSLKQKFWCAEVIAPEPEGL